MKRFVFVILHYNTIDDTHECVKSIMKYVRGGWYHIVIVDNCSPNKSGLVLKEEYEVDKTITVILNQENLGFAKGNNIGFRYAKEELKADFIILLNSDTELLDDTFVGRVLNEYEENGFAVLGPKIKIPYPPYIHQQDRETLISRIGCLVSMVKVSWNLLLNYIGIDLSIQKFKKKEIYFKEDGLQRKEYVLLHGCFLIFSPIYINKYDGLNPNTFLYREEDLLLLRLQRNGLKSVYLPTLEIFHKEKKSTDSAFSNKRQKRRFIYKQLIRSTYILYKEL